LPDADSGGKGIQFVNLWEEVGFLVPDKGWLRLASKVEWEMLVTNEQKVKVDGKS
jgi:hypothetical protein